MRPIRLGIYAVLAIIAIGQGDLVFPLILLLITVADCIYGVVNPTKQARTQPFYGSGTTSQDRSDTFRIYRETYFFELFGCLCKVDGVVTRDEILGVEAMFRHLKFDENDIESAKQAFRVGKSSDFDFEQTLTELRCLEIDPGLASTLIHLFNVVIANTGADGLVNEEFDLLVRIGTAYGLSEETVAEVVMRSTQRTGGYQQRDDGVAGRSSQKSSLELAFQKLSISREATAKQAERAYRRLRSRHHPDKLDRNISEQERKIAMREFDDVQRAWDIVRVHYGI